MRYQLRYVRVGGASAKHPTIADPGASTQRGPSGACTRQDGVVTGLQSAHVAAAHLGGLCATELVEVSHDPTVLDGGGRWAVLLPYDGVPILARFARWQTGAPSSLAGPWIGPAEWTTSMESSAYRHGVCGIQDAIARGEVYQTNLCRILQAQLPDPRSMDIGGLHALLHRDHPAPYSGMLRLPDQGVHIATASPELFVRRQGEIVESSPIKGTAAYLDQMLEKDRAENVMIVDLVRNDLSRVCRPGSVEVVELMEAQSHPGLVHLVSTVRGRLSSGMGWSSLLDATFPPGSVTGAPKFTALQIIESWETASRGPYCGAIGWVDADTGNGELAVAIRTFWIEKERGRAVVKFGTGAGITWGSDPQIEWQETTLKASRLTSVAGGRWSAPDVVGRTEQGSPSRARQDAVLP